MECISKGKSHKAYEFGCKVSVITTAHRSKGGQFALTATALYGNPYDGHTFKFISAILMNMNKQQALKLSVSMLIRGIEVMISH